MSRDPHIQPASGSDSYGRHPSPRLRRWLLLCYYFLSAGKWLGLAIWMLARLITDRTLTFQFLFWGSTAILLVTIILGAAAALTGNFAYRTTLERRSWLTRRHAFGISALCAITWLIIHDWHVLPALRQALVPPSPGQQQTLRIFHWNQSVFTVSNLKATTSSLTAHGIPDLMLISMQNNVEEWRAINAHLRAKLGQPPIAADDPQQLKTYGLPDGYTFTNHGMEKIWSRYPLLSIREFVVSMQDAQAHLRSAGAADPQSTPATPEPPVAIKQVHPAVRQAIQKIFDLTGSPMRPPERMEDATVTVIILDSHAALGRNLVIYWVDLPSNPLAWRHAITQRIAHHLRMLQSLPIDPSSNINPSIPRPDLIIGDFNIPTFSASIDRIAPVDPRGSFQHASQASVAISRLGSWPRPLNALGLDHALIAPDWIVSQYRLIDPAASEHMAQTMVIWPRSSPAAKPAK